jgi:hypothetical protein
MRQNVSVGGNDGEASSNHVAREQADGLSRLHAEVPRSSSNIRESGGVIIERGGIRRSE